MFLGKIISPPSWGYEQGAIELHLSSDPLLNLFQKQAHSLIVCLFQLKDPNTFKQQVDEKGGLERLLDCNRFDPSVTYSKRLVLQPNQSLSEVLDRTEGARFVGLVAGYYTLQKESSVLSFPIPVTEVEQGSTLVQKPAKLSVDLYLGSHRIDHSKVIEKKRQP